MFPSQQRVELVFGTRTTTTLCQPDNIISVENLIVDYSFDPLNISKSIDFASSQKIQTQFGGTDQREKEIRKTKHRDVERRRREEMSKLYASLKSLLPLDRNKGKLSISDHIVEAVNYTKQLQKKVHELRTRREMLKNVATSSGARKTTSSTVTNHNLPNCVTLNLGKDGMEILMISSSMNSSKFRLSHVIEELHDKELEVVGCVSTNINGRFLHKIQAEFSDLRLIDVSKLQQRLTEMIN